MHTPALVYTRSIFQDSAIVSVATFVDWALGTGSIWTERGRSMLDGLPTAGFLSGTKVRNSLQAANRREMNRVHATLKQR